MTIFTKFSELNFLSGFMEINLLCRPIHLDPEEKYSLKLPAYSIVTRLRTHKYYNEETHFNNYSLN